MIMAWIVATKINLVFFWPWLPSSSHSPGIFSQFLLYPCHGGQMFSLVCGSAFCFTQFPPVRRGGICQCVSLGKVNRLRIHIDLRPLRNWQVCPTKEQMFMRPSWNIWLSFLNIMMNSFVGFSLFFPSEKNQLSDLPPFPVEYQAIHQLLMSALPFMSGMGHLPEQCSLLLLWWPWQLIPSSHCMWQRAIPKLPSRVLQWLHYHFCYYGFVSCIFTWIWSENILCLKKIENWIV